MSKPQNIVFSEVQKYKAYLDKDGASPELTANTAILVESLQRTAKDDGAGWSTVGIGHSVSHGGQHIFEKAGLDWNKFNSTGRMSEAEAKQLFINGDYKRFEAIAHKHLGEEWFESQPANFQDAVVLEVFNKGERGFFHEAKPDQGYTDTIDTAKIEKLKSNDPKQIFEAFTTGQSVSASTKTLKGSGGDTVRERLASRRPWAGALAIAHLTETPGVVPIEYFDAMTKDPLLASMEPEEIIARSVKYTNSRGDLNLDGAKIPDFVASPETQYAYQGGSNKTRAYTSDNDDNIRRSHSNGRRKEDFLFDINDLPEGVQSELIGLFALILFVLGEPEQANALLASAFGDHIASPESYMDYDRKSGGGLGGQDAAKQLGKYNQDYQVANAPENWGKATPEAIAQAMTGKIIYQEQKGDGKTSYGTLTLINEQGKVVSFPVLTGGAGKGSLPGTANGTGAVDERYGVVIPDYTVGNYRGNRTDKLAHAMGGFSFDLLSNGKDSVAIPGEDRKYFRIHADGNTDGKTLGCIGCDPKDSAAMIAAIRSHDKGVAFKILPSEDKNNELATHFKNAPKKEVAEKSDNKADEPAIEQAKKLTAGIELKDMKIEGWPPGVDSSVLDAARAAEANRLA